MTDDEVRALLISTGIMSEFWDAFDLGSITSINYEHQGISTGDDGVVRFRFMLDEESPTDTTGFGINAVNGVEYYRLTLLNSRDVELGYTDNEMMSDTHVDGLPLPAGEYHLRVNTYSDNEHTTPLAVENFNILLNGLSE
jgi:hypothetical protein